MARKKHTRCSQPRMRGLVSRVLTTREGSWATRRGYARGAPDPMPRPARAHGMMRAMSAANRAEAVAGAKAVAPMLVGVIPFGLVCGATPATNGVGGWGAVGFSSLVFAGASQLTAIDSL